MRLCDGWVISWMGFDLNIFIDINKDSGERSLDYMSINQT